MAKPNPLLRLFDFAAYIIAAYNLSIVYWAEDRYVLTAGAVCFGICMFQLIRMYDYYIAEHDATLFNKASMVVISNDELTPGKKALARLDGIYYMHNGRKED